MKIRAYFKKLFLFYYYFKHDANTAIRKANINVLQSFDEIKLYVSPTNQPVKDGAQTSAQETNSLETPSENAPLKGSASTKLPRRNQSFRMNPNQIETSEIVETNLKEILDKIIESVSASNVTNWFTIPNSHKLDQAESDEQNSESSDLFSSILNALNHIDYNLKRNSDFINELTKLLDTSRAIKQEAQLKKILKSLEEEKSAVPASQNAAVTSLSQPPSPLLRSTNTQSIKDEEKRNKNQKVSRVFRSVGPSQRTPRPQSNKTDK